MTEHFDWNISIFPSRLLGPNPLKSFISSLKNPTFSNFTFYEITIYFLQYPVTNFHFIPQNFWCPFFHQLQIGLFFNFFHLSTPSPLIHNCKNSLSSLYIFVHHCTFCASLHVKTCPAVGLSFRTNWNSLQQVVEYSCKNGAWKWCCLIASCLYKECSWLLATNWTIVLLWRHRIMSIVTDR